VSKKGVVAEEVFFTVADQFPELAQQAEFFARVAEKDFLLE